MRHGRNMRQRGPTAQRTPIQRAIATITSMFASGEQGVWYDPSDMRTLFQDSAGTTPVTAVEQPVGLMLDKSKGLVLGPELFSGSAPVNSSGTVVVGAGVITCTCTTAGVFGIRAVNFSVIGGRSYRVDISWSGNTNGRNIATDVGLDGGFSIGTAASGSMSLVRVPTGGGSFNIYAVNGQIGDTFTISSISVRELPGNHAQQPTATKRPVLSARYNLLTTSQPTALPYCGISVSATSLSTALFGGPAYRVVGNENYIYITAVTGGIQLKAGIQYVGSFYSDKPTPTYSYFYDAYYVGTVSMVAPGLYRHAITQTPRVNATLVWHIRGLVDNMVGGFQFETGSTPTQYQRVNTATDYDTVGFKPYLKFDGIDDALYTNSIDFTATDKMTVVAGVRKLSDADPKVLIELSATSANPGVFAIYSPESAAANTSFFSRGSLDTVSALASGIASPITSVLTGLGNIAGDSAILRRNGTQVATSAYDQGTGTYGNYPLFIGARSGTGLPFNGQLHSLIVRGAQSSEAQISAAERYSNSKTGAF